jgi:ABC-type glycerol-3-phosphate transport system substrate-binding protein
MERRNLFSLLVLLAVLVFSACGNGGEATSATQGQTQANNAPTTSEGGSSDGDGSIAGLGDDDEVDVIEGAGDITLRLTWLSGGGLNREGIIEGLRPFVEKTGAGVDIIYVTGDWAEYFTKIQLMVAAGEKIDLANVAIEGFEMLVGLGLAVPIDDWVSRNQAEFDAVANEVSPNVMDIMNFGGQQYGIPNEWNNVVTHINTNMLEEAGLPFPQSDWGRDTFLEYAQAMTKTREDGTRQFGVFVPNFYFGFQSWLFNNGTTYMSEDFTESNLLDPAVIEMFQFMYDLIYVYEVAPIPEPGLNPAHMLIQGDLGMHFAGRWPTMQYYEAGFKDVAVQYVPQFTQGHNDVVWGGTGVFTLRTSEYPDQATSLAVYLASADFVEPFMGAGAIPTLNSVAERLVPALGIPQNHELFITSAAHARPVQSPVQYAEVANLVHTAFSDVLINQRDVETVLREADAQLQLVLFDNR